DVRRARRDLYAFHAACAAAVLLKGLVGVVLPGGAIVLWALVTGRWRTLARVFLPGPILLFCALAVPWHVAMALRHPDFLQFYFVHEHFQRFATTEHRRAGPPVYFIPVLLAGFLPWTGFFGRFREVWPGFSRGGWRARGTEGFLWIWSVLGFGVEAHPVRLSYLARALGASCARHRARPRARRGVPRGPAPLGGVLRAPLRGGSGLRVGRGISRAIRERAHGAPRALSPARRGRPQRLASTFRRAARRRSRAHRGRAMAHLRGGASHRASRRGARDHAVADRLARPRGSGTGRSPPAEGALPRGAAVLPRAPHAGGVARVERAGLRPLAPRIRGALSVRGGFRGRVEREPAHARRRAPGPARRIRPAALVGNS